MTTVECIEVIEVEPARLREWEPVWRALDEQAPGAAPFVCFDWLAAWTAIYAPARLAVLRVGEPAAPVALGLLELGRGGRWRFAGRPVASERGLLCADDDFERAWSAVGRWLRVNSRRWATLEAAGLMGPAEGALAAALRVPAPVPVLTLPESFEAYLEARPRTLRKNFRRVLRRVDEEQVELGPVRDADVAAALHDFVVLHKLRAASKGERHPAVDDRLERVLAALADVPSARLRMLEVVHRGRRVGATVRLERPGGSWFYNGGFDPAAARLAPGVALDLASIRDAIERGISRVDLGPGAHRYKLDLGSVIEERVDVVAASRSARGRALGAAEAGLRQARARVPVRTLARQALARVGRS